MPHYAPHRLLACTLALGALAGMVLTPRAHAGESAPFAAQAGLDIAGEAARTWAADAFAALAIRTCGERPFCRRKRTVSSMAAMWSASNAWRRPRR